MRIILDVDGVLADFIGSALDVINALDGADRVPADVVRWEIEELLPEHLRDAFFWHVEQPGFARNMRPLRGEVHLARELIRCGHDVVIATSPWKTSAHWVRERSEWLARWLGVREVHHTHAKAHIRGDVFVDDKPSHVDAWSRANPAGAGYLFDATYNQHSELPRIKSLRELLPTPPTSERGRL